MNMQWSNITLICAVIISQLTIYGGAHPKNDHTTDVGNNVPWIFDTEEAMVPLVSVTDEQREQELKYQNTLQYAKNLCVMAVTAKNITMPTYIYHDISVMELYQLLDGSSLRRKYNLHQQLLDKLDHADTVTQEICKELRGHPPTRNVVFPTGESALVIEDLDAYEKSISNLTADKISTLFDELLGGGEIVIETKLLKTLTPESFSDINAQFLIRRVGDFYSVNLGGSFKGARRENVLGAAKHDSEKLVAYEDWVNNKRNLIRYIAELINAENVQNMVKPINDKQMVFLQALWFELFKTIESQIRLLVSVRLFRRAVIEITSNPTSEGKLAQVSAKGLELIYDGMEYNILNDKQMISFHHKLEKLITMLRNMYDVDISHLNLQDETNYIDLNTTTESKVDKVEFECVSSHLINYYKSMDTDVDIMKKTTRKMKELGFKKGVTHKNVMQTLAKTNTMVGHLADILVDAHDNILDIERDVNGIHDGEVDTEVSPVKLLDRVYKLTAELSGVRMIMIEIYKSSCEIYRCDIEGNHIDVPDSFIEEIAKLTKRAQIALANTQVRYFEFRKAAGLMKDKAMALERSHRMESGKTALKLYQELVKPRRGIDIILRYFAYIDDYKNELNKMERIIQNAKHTSTENKSYQILQNYFDASKSIHDSLLLEKIIQTAMDMEIEFEKKVMTIEQHACQQKQYMKVKAKNIKNTRKNKQAKTKPLTDYEDARGHGNVEGAYVISPPHGAQIWDVAHDIIPQSHRVDELPKEPIVLKLEEHIPQAVQPTINGDKDDDSIHQNSASDCSATPPLSFTSKTGILTTEQDTMPSVDKKTNMESGDLDQFHSFTSSHEPATDSDQHTSTSGETESSQTEKTNSEQWSQSGDEVSDYSMLTDYEDARGHGNLEGAYVISPPHGAQIWDVAHDIIPQSHRVDELPKEPIVLKLEEHIPQAVQPTINGDKDDDSIHQNSASDCSATPPLSFTSKTGILTTEQDTMPSVDKKTNMESGDLDQFHSFTSSHEPATDSDQHTSTSGETESSQTEKTNSEQWSQSGDEVSDYSMLTDYEDARGHGNLEGAYVISPPHGAQIWDVAHDIIPQSHRVDELPKEPIVLKLEEHIPQAVQPTINGDKDDDSIHQNSASDCSATPPLSFTSKTGILTTEQDTMPSVDKKTNMESGDLDQFHSFTSSHEPATDSDQHTSTSGETESSQTEKTNSEQWSQSGDEVSDYSMLTDYEDARGHGNLEGAYVISPPHGAQIWDVAHDIIPQSHRLDELPKEPIVLKLEEHIPQAVQPTINGDRDDGVRVPLCKPDDKDCADAMEGFFFGKLLDDAPDIYGFVANSGAYLYRGGMLLCRAAGATLGLVPNILSSMMPVASDGGASSRSQSPETPALDSMDQQVDSSPVDKTNKAMDMVDVNVAPQDLEKSVKDGRSTMEPKLRSNLGTNRSSADDRPTSKLLTRMVDEALSAPIVPSISSSFATVTCTLLALAYAVVLAG